MKNPVRAYGSSTRAADGCIVTFELPDGSIRVERFNEIVRTRDQRGWRRRKVTREDGAYIQQAADRADELGAKIVCVSTPQTILTDLQGTRARLEAVPTGLPEGRRGGMQIGPANFVAFPELSMLQRIKRVELFKRPAGGQPSHNIRQVTQRKPTHTGFTDWS